MPYIGEIRLFAGNFAPAGWAFCKGQPVPIAENDALFVLIGTRYGGDGQQSFNLPNLASRVPIHAGTGPDGTVYQLGEMAGTEQETLTTQQIPNHAHPLTASTGPGTDALPTSNVLAQSGGAFVYIEDTATAALNPSSIQPAGGSQPHENTQPFLCINFIISLFGEFPRET
ncbi:MAG: tail fiber protein [Chloroflexota bacterium]|nr:tail fiber protein [Chloroflexota bacterium]